MRILIGVAVLSLSTLGLANTTYLGLYMQGSKIGYASYDSGPSKLNGVAVVRSFSRTLLNTGLLGSKVVMLMDSTSWATTTGKPLRILSDTSSSGRSNRVDALFEGRLVTLKIENGGVKSKVVLTLPKDGQVVDDPLTTVLASGFYAVSNRTLYVLDSSTASFMKNRVKVVGPAKAEVRGKMIVATLVEIVDSRSTTKVFLDKKGNLVRVDGPAGIYMLPVSRAVALGRNSKYNPLTDLAASTSIKPNILLIDPASLTHLKLRISGPEVTILPSDRHQNAVKSGAAWIVDIHPTIVAKEPKGSIKIAASQKPAWLKPSLNIPCDSLQFRTLSHSIIGSKNDVQTAAFAVQCYVYQNMKPNAGIGVLRDASEVLRSKEGVCRDYAILTVTLLRAAGIPARLASGLVDWDDSFYYHAWAEAWDGNNWIGVDSTTDDAQLSASHVKLSDGNVETAFSFTFLGKAKIEVLESGKD